LPTLRDEKKAEELLLSNAAMKKRQLELEEEVWHLDTHAHQQQLKDESCFAGQQAET
jgi:hypothetical protein